MLSVPPQFIQYTSEPLIPRVLNVYFSVVREQPAHLSKDSLLHLPNPSVMKLLSLSKIKLCREKSKLKWRAATKQVCSRFVTLVMIGRLSCFCLCSMTRDRKLQADWLISVMFQIKIAPCTRHQPRVDHTQYWVVKMILMQRRGVIKEVDFTYWHTTSYLILIVWIKLVQFHIMNRTVVT